jgi:hypothetical protein
MSIATAITLDQLLRIIESIVFTGPIGVEELKAHIKLTIGHSPDADDLETILTALEDKYNAYLYGVAFSRSGGLLEFKSRSVQEILNH